MSEEEKLKFYLEKIKTIASENIEGENMTAIEALKNAINFVEGEMIGY